MDPETPLTPEELTQALRKLQNDNANLWERLAMLGRLFEQHTHTTPELLEPVSLPRSQRQPQSPLPSRLRPT
jgi:hypothetical protein